MNNAVQGEWNCPRCVKGEAPPPRQACTMRELYLTTQGVIKLAEIQALFEERGETMFTARWFCRPEDTRSGRRVRAPNSTACSV